MNSKGIKIYVEVYFPEKWRRGFTLRYDFMGVDRGGEREFVTTGNVEKSNEIVHVVCVLKISDNKKATSILKWLCEMS